jgi:hypothetical protein
MTPGDKLAVGLWIAGIVAMLVLAWEPWRQGRRQGAIDLSDGAIGRAISPFYVFMLPLLVAVAPFVAQFVPRPGENIWRHPHLLMPMGAIELALLVVFQAYFRSQVLTALRRRREARAETEALLSAERRS